ncbi:MAG: hypothetical protein KDD42_10020 [Bdellovibrionales bacterium]|nr:hypothetical protein [Bdellovibrionales bacterium]
MEAPKNLQRIARQLFSDSNQQAAFIQALTASESWSQALVWVGERPQPHPFQLQTPVDFQPTYVDLLAPHQEAGTNQLHKQGFYYCLDLSSVFAGKALESIACSRSGSLGPRVLDMCAAPGGKAVLASVSLSPDLLICNEVIGKRLPSLISNLSRLNLPDWIVTSRDSAWWRTECSECFELVICDVPCSGQSLIVRGKQSGGCFHPATINMNSNRQKRIIANSLHCVTSGGYLAYMTCTFSIQENEKIIEWALRKFSDFEPVVVEALSAYRSHLTDLPFYRLWPQQQIGAGAAVALLRRKGEAGDISFDASRLPVIQQSTTAKSAAPI